MNLATIAFLLTAKSMRKRWRLWEHREDSNDCFYSPIVKSFVSTSLLLFVFLTFGFSARSSAWGQDSTLTIRVESHQVLVPISCLGPMDCTDGTCSWDGETRPDVDQNAHNPFGLGFVSVKRLRIFEDGKEQRIQKVERITSGDSGVRSDNLGTHAEWASIPEVTWATSDQNAGLYFLARERRDSKEPRGRRLTSLSGTDYYVIAYTPPPSPEGSCHRIQIKTKHGSRLDYRREYCNVHHSSSDTLRGTPVGNTLEQHITLGEPGSLHIAAEASYFYTAPDKARVRVELEVPFDEVKPREWSDGALPFNLLIIAQGKDRSVVERRSDQTENPDFSVSKRFYRLEEAAALSTPTRYEAQMELPPGEYRLAIAVSHGPKFGTTEVPLTIDNYDGKKLGISSIALCKRVRRAGDDPVASEFVPLVSNRYEFTPAAETVFHKGGSPMVYFEIYEPKSVAPKQNSSGPAQTGRVDVRFQMRLVNPITGAVEMKTEMSAAPWIQPGESTIPIAVEPQLKTLPAGKYRLEVKGSDAGGANTFWRSADFLIADGK